MPVDHVEGQGATCTMGITVVSITLSQHNKFHLERRKWNEHTFSEQQCGVVVVLDRNFGNAHNFCSLL